MEKAGATIIPADSQSNEDKPRQISEIPFPGYGLADSIAVAKAVHDKAGGYATREQLSAFLGYKSLNNGAFLSRMGAAKTFGLLTEEEKKVKLTPLAHQILMPETKDQHRAALVEAFFNVPLFKAIYDEYRGKDLPEGLGLKNALRLRFKVVPGRIDIAHRALVESAETAGFFETRGGSKTQLIVPVLMAPLKPAAHEKKNEEHGGGGGSGNGGDGTSTPPPLPKSRDDLQNAYIGTLIEVLREKSKSGEVDQDLMARIERLLELKNS